MPNDTDFNTFFNDDPASGYTHSTWDAPAMIDPRISTNGYPQPSNGWDQNHLQGSNTLHQPLQTMQNNHYDNTFAQGPPIYNGYLNVGHYQPYTNSPYQTTPLPYTQDSMLTNAAFPDHSARGYSDHTFQSQTISPAALQNYPPPNQFPQFQSQPENESTVDRQPADKQVSPFYDHSLLVIASPNLNIV